MAHVMMYLAPQDCSLLVDRLNADGEIHALVRSPIGWIATSEIETLPAGRLVLWHAPSGPPRLPPFDAEIDDPFVGWTPNIQGADPSTPYFGAGEPRTFVLDNRSDPLGGGLIRISGIEWIGNHYAAIGNPAPEGAKRWWSRLGRWLAKVATKVPRGGTGSGKPSVWAFPSAMAEIHAGRPCSSSPI